MFRKYKTLIESVGKYQVVPVGAEDLVIEAKEEVKMDLEEGFVVVVEPTSQFIVKMVSQR